MLREHDFVRPCFAWELCFFVAASLLLHIYIDIRIHSSTCDIFVFEAFRAILYMIGLGYCFLGVAIIADVFMSSIEKITSKRLHVHNPETKKTETKLVSDSSLLCIGS